jgi:hypothetical protein
VALTKKNFLLIVAAGIAVVTVGLAACLVLLTRDADLEFAQNPNSVEAHEAKRKLALFNEAQSAKRKGFVRFSEVEINSFLAQEQKKDSRTNSAVRLVRSSVLLTPPNITFVSWHTATVLGVNLPFVWQRTVNMNKGAEGWSFSTRQMRVGTVTLPETCWPWAEKFFGHSDHIFNEREEWLAKLPEISLNHNDASRLPELRLYTYLPEHSRP